MGRYMTVAKNNKGNIRDETSASINRLTKRETVALMHATVTGIRQSAAFWVIGMDRTQSIAIDEIFQKKTNEEGVANRQTMTLRTSAKSRSTLANLSDEEDEVIEAPTQVMRGAGLCSGRNALNLTVMVILWVTSNFNYAMIGIYMKYVPGTIYVNYSISGMSEILAHIIVGTFYVKLTPRWTYCIGYSIALVGGALLLF